MPMPAAPVIYTAEDLSRAPAPGPEPPATAGAWGTGMVGSAVHARPYIGRQGHEGPLHMPCSTAVHARFELIIILKLESRLGE